jgi:hypothetical protein
VACSASRVELEPVLPMTSRSLPYFLAVCAISMMCSSHDIRCPSPVVPPTISPCTAHVRWVQIEALGCMRWSFVHPVLFDVSLNSSSDSCHDGG